MYHSVCQTPFNIPCVREDKAEEMKVHQLFFFSFQLHGPEKRVPATMCAIPMSFFFVFFFFCKAISTDNH